MVSRLGLDILDYDSDPQTYREGGTPPHSTENEETTLNLTLIPKPTPNPRP